MHIEHIPAAPPFVLPTGEPAIAMVAAGVYGPEPVRAKTDMFVNAVGQQFMRRVVAGGVAEWTMVVQNDRHCPLGQRCQFVTGRFAYGRRR